MLLSIIMSVYNEKISEFLEALNSIQNQTYKNIEIIVIIDNPARKDIECELKKIDDSRIIYKVNKKNIGLADSMNLAANMAKGEYLVRMDADDISYPDRLQKELEQLKKTNADYVCSWFDYIDEDGKKIDKKVKFYKNEIINEMLPYNNCIHHPTVIIKKDAFFQVGGYRNFPCAQDYDLWLRLFDMGYRVTIVENVLLSYRIRESSTTSQKRVQQHYTVEYARRLLRERHKYGKDSYSTENYQMFLEKKGTLDPKKTAQWKKGMEKKQQLGRWYYFVLAVFSDFFRGIVVDAIRCRWMEIYLSRLKSLFTKRKDCS